MLSCTARMYVDVTSVVSDTCRAQVTPHSNATLGKITKMPSEDAIKTLKEAIQARIPGRVKLATKLLMNHAQATIHEVTVESVMTGMRGLPCVIWEVSESDHTGVRYHGKSIKQLESLLPKYHCSDQLSPEAVLWYLYTATVPSRTQLEHFTADLVSRAELPDDVKVFMDGLSLDFPPTTHMVMALSALGRHSKFIAALGRGVPKRDMWKNALEDALDATARVPMIAARIHANFYRRGSARDIPLDHTADLAKNFALRMGRADDQDFTELVRLYWALHMDHGASVSAHTGRLCSSAWADAYMSLSAALIAGTGTLHAMAITNSVEFNLEILRTLGSKPTSEQMEKKIVDTLAGGNVVPGYGHAVLRGTDPRFELISAFAEGRKLEDGLSERGELVELVKHTNRIVPGLLKKHVPRLRNPAPNVDALSGSLMHAYGLESEYLVTVMACSRTMGFLAQYTWDRALGLSLERPMSITMDQILAKVETE